MVPRIVRAHDKIHFDFQGALKAVGEFIVVIKEDQPHFCAAATHVTCPRKTHPPVDMLSTPFFCMSQNYFLLSLLLTTCCFIAGGKKVWGEGSYAHSLLLLKVLLWHCAYSSSHDTMLWHTYKHFLTIYEWKINNSNETPAPILILFHGCLLFVPWIMISQVFLL